MKKTYLIVVALYSTNTSHFLCLCRYHEQEKMLAHSNKSGRRGNHVCGISQFSLPKFCLYFSFIPV